MNEFYEVFTNWKTGVPVLPADLVANAVFELGEPVQTLGGTNGFLTEVSKDGEEGVLDISPSNVYQAPVVIVGTVNVGDLIYFDISDGTLTNVAGALAIFATAVRVSYDETFPKTAGTITVGMKVA